MEIKVRYSSVDRYSKTRTFKTLKFARKFAIDWIGRYPEIGIGYAVSGDGVGKITVSGTSLASLFGEEPTPDPVGSDEMSAEEGAARYDAYDCGAIEAERANERHYEGDGYDADYDRRMEDSRGVIQFDDAFRAACPEMFKHEKED